ncbi:acyltransferase, partial [Phenylobacterium sp.]|uniref:acyltransferase family protein n=1 Tax=Phenylobacterium sp. TaxID=1871053 RepID=UPI0027364046
MSWFGIETRTSVPPIERGGWLDAMRIVVAILMILHHYELAGPSPTSDFIPFFERGYLLTDFFLIDSGYVLARVYGERVLAGGMSLSDFFKKRFLRVVPAHLIMQVTLISLVVLSGLLGVMPRNPQWFDWNELPAQFFLVQSYGVPGGRGWNAPSWSLSALLGCYLMFPLLLRGMARFNPFVMLGLGIAAFTACNLATWAILDYPVYQMPLKFGIFRALPLFMLGMALARFAQKV